MGIPRWYIVLEGVYNISHRTNINITTTTITKQTAGKMAQSGAPVTIRDFLNDDPFFKNTWEDFDKLTEGMFSEPRSTWKRFDQDFRNRTCMQKSSQETTSREERRESIKESSRNDSYSRQHNGWMSPHHWMLPGLNSKFPKGLDSLKTNEDDSKMEVSLDTSQYRPDELKVSVEKGVVTVEGKHEEKAEDGSKMVSRMFSKKYTLPADAKDEDVVSKLSSDGVLVVTAPRNSLAIK